MDAAKTLQLWSILAKPEASQVTFYPQVGFQLAQLAEAIDAHPADVRKAIQEYTTDVWRMVPQAHASLMSIQGWYLHIVKVEMS